MDRAGTYPVVAEDRLPLADLNGAAACPAALLDRSDGECEHILVRDATHCSATAGIITHRLSCAFAWNNSIQSLSVSGSHHSFMHQSVASSGPARRRLRGGQTARAPPPAST